MNEGDPLTVHVLCLHLLGGMHDRDPSILWMSPPGSDWPPPKRPIAIHPLDRPVPTVGRVLVEQSEGALLRVLARHLGWDGCRPLAMRARRWAGPRTPVYWALDGCLKTGQIFRRKLPEHISADLSYHEALAAAVVWYARIERAYSAHSEVHPEGDDAQRRRDASRGARSCREEPRARPMTASSDMATPTEPGWYWYRFLHKAEAEIVQVYRESQPHPHLRFRQMGSTDWRPEGGELGEWLGPVEALTACWSALKPPSL